MLLCSVAHLVQRFRGEILFQLDQFEIHTGDKIGLIGANGCGKTTFLEAALLATGVINRLGKVEDGNTVSDYDKMEIEKGYSISLSIVPVEYNKVKINFLDTPGFFDFIGEVDSAMRAVDAAMILVDASSGIQVGTEKAWNSCKQYNMPVSYTHLDVYKRQA